MSQSIQYALLSVSDKTGIVEFAKELSQLGIVLFSTGGTAKLLIEADIKVTEVSDYTGFPELMAGRVKTLHPKIHGGLLGRRGVDDAVMEAHNMLPIGLLVVNLYPFAKTMMQPSSTLEQAIENIDIGGPAMVRSAAKNYVSVGVIVDCKDYPKIISELNAEQVTLTDVTRFKLAQKAFAHSAEYDGNIANYLGSLDVNGNYTGFPLTYTCQFQCAQALRYGENPHQHASFYHEPNVAPGTLGSAKLLQGKPLSYNNIADADVAINCALEFVAPACVIVKHANPCGVAVADSMLTAYGRAYETDPSSAFGGIIAFNHFLDTDVISAILDRQFVEVIIAPQISEAAILRAKDKPMVRLLQTGQRCSSTIPKPINIKRVSGGVLLQEADIAQCRRADMDVVSERVPTLSEWDDLLFAWKVVKYIKSNAIVLVKDQQAIGIGAGQMSRIYSMKIATDKATDQKLDVVSAVLASDAFFPFSDTIEEAKLRGIKAIIQPGGAKRDNEIIAACNKYQMAMVFTHMRHFSH